MNKWIIIEEPKKGIPKRWRVRCSNCNKGLKIADRKLWNYCPYCGAKMERRTDEHNIKRD